VGATTPGTPHRDRRAALSVVLVDLAEAVRRADPRSLERVHALADKLEAERFVVVVVGEFKRGKSTLVNALLGADLLPTSAIPLTSVVTLVTYGPPCAEIIHRDGSAERVDLDRLARYVTERHNPGNALGVDRAIVRFPSPLVDGIVLVDTPGVGSVHEHNSASARAFLPEADAAVFLISADQPLSANELDFLREVRAEAVRTFFVLNKIDNLSADDRREAVAYVRSILEDEVCDPVELFAVSARRGLEAKLAGSRELLVASGLATFEASFGAFMADEKLAALVRSTASAGRRVADEATNALAVQGSALRLALDRLREVTAEIERIFAEAGQARDELRPLASAALERIMAMIDEDLATFREREARAILADVDRLVGTVPAGAADRSAPAARQLIEERLAEGAARWLRDERRKVAAVFAERIERLSTSVDGIVERTIRSCGELLDVRLQARGPDPELAERFRIRYGFTEVPSLMGSLMPDRAGIPRGDRARRRAARELADRVPEMVEMYSGRLRAGFLEQLREGRRVAEHAFDRRLEESIGALREGLVRAREARERGEHDASARQRALDAARGTLDEIRERLTAIAAEDRGRTLSVSPLDGS
jgi:small GTP-binding protein